LSLTPGAEAWTPLAIEGQGPTGYIVAMYYDAALHGFYVLAGTGNDSQRRDLLTLTKSGSTWTWSSTPLWSSRLRPGKRSRHGSSGDQLGEIAVFFGESESGQKNDFWMFTSYRGSWAQVAQDGGIPTGRSDFASALASDTIYVHGGTCTGLGTCSGELYQ